MTLAPDSGRLSYLGEVAGLLWPQPARFGPGAAAARDTGPDQALAEFFLLPGVRRPRLLVPAERRAGAAALRRYGEPRSWTAAAGSRALSLALASGAAGLLLRNRKLVVRAPEAADTVETYLGTVLGTRVLVSMHLGPARANRKPVLQLVTPLGATVGFAKIGINPFTRELVRAERDALNRLNERGLTTLAVPKVLHYGTWRGLDLLVLDALPVWLRRRPLPADRLATAMREVAWSCGVRRGPLAGSSYWERLGARLASAEASADRDALLTILSRLEAAGGGACLGYGHWHGDWTSWNMASTRRGLLVWDWERFTGDVPLGFDALHYWLQHAAAPGNREPAIAAADCVGAAPRLLAPFAVPAGPARLTALLYLAELGTRYLLDKQARAGARLGAPGRWLIPALARALAGQ
ncbi:MAG: hypothetical protein J2P35_14870 [Actinobacteria bacterium]|nr:hypothetical protein [Actinomycetota bacterium]MBO0784601.1 hypothetical protein [Actinomycetota bacterium]MBO0815333.1 hypothetical protein [Actinomycetota bacterium]